MDGLVFQSEGARDFFDEKIRAKSVVIHNSVEVPVDKYPVPLNRRKRIVSAGRLHEQKNHSLLIDAFAKIASDIPEYELVIYGDGDLRESLQKKIYNYKLNDRISLLSACKDLWDKIHDASLFVLSSDFEGMPNVSVQKRNFEVLG